MHEIEERFGQPIRDVLYRLYVVEERPLREVARVLGVDSDSTIWLWMVKLGLPRRRWLLPPGDPPPPDSPG